MRIGMGISWTGKGWSLCRNIEGLDWVPEARAARLGPGERREVMGVMTFEDDRCLPAFFGGDFSKGFTVDE
jgi:hypothetical protein